MNMDRSRRRGRLSVAKTAALSALALIVTACGGDDAPPQAEPSAPVQAPAAPDPVAKSWSELGVAGTWDEILAAAAAEGELIVSVHRGGGYEAWCSKVVDVMATYSVIAKCTASSPSDWVGRVIAEQQAGQYLWDVGVMATGNIQAALLPADGAQPLRPWFDLLGEVGDDGLLDEANWEGGLVFSDDSDRVFLNEYILSGGAYVNVDVMGPDLQPDKLSEAALKGRIVSRDPTNVNGGSMSLAWFSAQDKFGEVYVDTIVNDQEMVFVESPSLMLEWVSDGRASVGFGANIDDLRKLQDAGLAKNIYQTDWAQYVIAYGAIVLPDNPNPNATAVFLNWFLSYHGQQIWADVTRYNSSSRRIGVTFPSPKASPKYSDMSRYPPVIGTAEGTKAVTRITEIALN